MANFLLLVTIIFGAALPLSLAVTQESCDHGALKFGKLCVGQCFLNTTCRCTAVTGSSLEHCVEYCLTSDCPEMYCEGGKSCSQHCEQASCNMECLANEQFCEQNCTASAECGSLTCSSRKCTQSCANCSMTCTREVEHCTQVCLGGGCNITCAARNCRHSCGNGTECIVKEKGGVNSAIRPATNSLLSLVIYLLIGCSLKWIS